MCKTQMMAEAMTLAPPETLRGALQRGRKCAARRLLTRPADVASIGLVLDCSTSDRRWDRQVEFRRDLELAGWSSLRVQTVFISLAALTLPHMILVDALLGMGREAKPSP